MSGIQQTNRSFQRNTKIEEVDHLEMLVTACQKTWLHIPESCDLNFHYISIFQLIALN